MDKSYKYRIGDVVLARKVTWDWLTKSPIVRLHRVIIKARKTGAFGATLYQHVDGTWVDEERITRNWGAFAHRAIS